MGQNDTLWGKQDQVPTRKPYSGTNPDELTLRDLLARDRTVLANERTLLSYVRTAFGFAAAGGTLLKLFPEESLTVGLGFTLLAAGGLTALLGFARFRSVSKNLREIERLPPT